MLRLLIITILLFTFSANADEETKVLDFKYSVLSSADTKIAKQALAASKSKKWDKAAKIANSAKDDIVYDIIKWVEFKEAKQVSQTELATFINRRSDFPLQTTFKKRLGLEPHKDNRKKEWRKLAEKARDLLEAKQPTKAYKTIKNAYKKLGGGAKADALWLSGWINLRFLNKPKKALSYFKLLHENVGYPISLSRAQYWMARSYEQLGDNQKARFWYSEAARHITTFYGQLGAQKLDADYIIELPQYSPPDFLDAKNFIRDPRIKAARILDEIGKPDYSRLFLIKYLNEKDRSVQDYSLVALLGQQTINYEWAVLAGKKAAQAGTLIPEANYPVLSYTPPAPEKALMMAIIRQESQLNRYAKSPVGASGLMQLMPATAKSVAKQIGVRYSKSLLFDKNYNMQLGSYYINKRVNDFDGSYILAIASYNAGIGNAYKWIERFGDPRKATKVDEIVDWLEMIPFSETRNYVQRVAETLQIYRARLKGGRSQLTLIQDLKR